MKYYLKYKWYYNDAVKQFEIPESLYTALAVMQPRAVATKSVHRVINGLCNHVDWAEQDDWELIIVY